VAGLTACSSSGDPSKDSGKQTVTFWQFDTAKPTIKAYNDAIAAFEKKNPKITVKMQIVPWANQQQKITTAIAGGGLPDVSMLGNDVVAQYAASGNLKPLDSYIDAWSKEEGQNIKDDMYSGDTSYYTYKGKLYGSPVADETRMVYYNKALFKQAGLDPDTPPTTWEEMQKAATALKSTGKVPWAAPMSNQYITVQTFMSVYLSYGAQLFNSSGKCGLDTKQFKDALTYYSGIAKAGLTTTDAANQQASDLDNLFMSGGAAMEIQGPGLYTQIKDQNPSLLKDVGIAPIPSGPKGQFGFLGGWPLVMWNSTKVPDAAAKWIHFATSPKGGLKEIAATSGILPGRKSLANSAPWNTEPFTGFAKQLTKAYPYQYPAGPSPKMGEIETASVQTAVQQVATGALSVDAATKQLCSNINGILAK
jgi:ABC-type glycerol-3-phosphate transport system substrate-binding protein